MKSRYIILSVLLGAVTGCWDDGPSAPQISAVLPAVVPAYATPTLKVSGQGFLPQVSVDSRDNVVDVTSDVFRLHLVPETASQAGCVQGEVPLQDVRREGSTLLTGVLPEGVCPGTYRVEAIDPRGAISTGSVLFTISDRYPDHLRIYEGGCDDLSAAEPASFPIEVELDDPRTISVRVVGPEGEAPSTFPPNLELAEPLEQPVELRVLPDDAYNIVDLGSDVFVEDPGAPASPGERVYRGTLNGDGCADFILGSAGPARIELTAIPDTLPGEGADPTASGAVAFIPNPTLSLVIDTPVDVFANAPFPLHVTATLDGDGQAVDGCLRFSVKDQPSAVITADPTLGLDCPSGTWPLQDGEFNGMMTLFRRTDRGTYIVAELISAPEVDGLSEVFTVGPDRAESLYVAGPTAATAGQPFVLDLRMEDAFGNAVDFQAGQGAALGYDSADLTCEPGMLDETDGMLHYPCDVTQAGSGRIISATVTLAATSESEAASLFAQTGPFDVQAGPTYALTLGLPEGRLTAGEGYPARLRTVDSYGNQTTSESGALTLSLVGGQDTDLIVDEAPFLVFGEADLTLHIKPAGDHRIRATFAPFVAEARAEVIPGPHSAYALATAAPFPLTAGDLLPLTLRAVDDYGNLIASLSGPQPLAFVNAYAPPEAPSGEPPEEHPIADAPTPTFVDGVAQSDVRLTLAQEGGTLRAVDEQGREGRLEGLSVEHGLHVGFNLRFDDTAVWVSRAFEAEIRAVDDYGNLIPEFEEGVSFGDDTGTLSPEEGGPFVGGVLMERFRIERSIVDNALSVAYFPDGIGAGGSIASDSAPFPVLEDCPGQLAVDLSLMNLDNPARAAHCLDDGPLGGARLDAQASVEFVGAGVGLRYVWSHDAGDGGIRGGSAQNTFVYTEAGHYYPSVTVWDPVSLCGATDVTELFVGPDDHRPVGRLTLTASRDPVQAGGSADAVTTITVAGQTCRQDALPADGDPFSVLAATSYGTLEGLDTNPNLPGFQGVWNTSRAQLNFQVDLSVVGQDQETTSRVVVGTPSGSALGFLDIGVVNDTHAPHVVSYGPTGKTRGDITQAYVRFSEPMRADSILDYGNVVLTRLGPGMEGDVELVQGVDFTLSLTQDDTLLRITLAPPLDTTTYALRVRLRSVGGNVIADLSGQPLNGNWNGALEYDDSFQFLFGAVEDSEPPVVLTCAPLSRVFSPATYVDPDGTGQGVQFGLSLRDDTSVKAWRLGIYGVDDEPVYEMFGILSAKVYEETVVSWFGNKTSGPMVPNGTYWYEVEGLDSYGNLSTESCGGTVEVQNPFDLGTD